MKLSDKTNSIGENFCAQNGVELYRYGFNGQEKDDEITGVVGSHLNFKYRMYDSRIGRFFAVDPLTAKYPELTPYQFASLNPIWMREIEGLEGTEANKAEAKGVLDEAISSYAKTAAETVVAFQKNEESSNKFPTKVYVGNLKNDFKSPSLWGLSDENEIYDLVTEPLESGEEVTYTMVVSVPIAQKSKYIKYVSYTNVKEFPEGVPSKFNKPAFYVQFWDAIPN
ncbi:MAG: hypothetical protein KKA07_17900, partial [Bacteroidetes bacterium]|nr:hypothetical protein [Bacteroidota bacterium]